MSKAKTILVIEDNVIIMNVAKLTMQRMGVNRNVKYLKNGFEATDYLISILEDGLLFPDSIYMDLNEEVYAEPSFSNFFSIISKEFSGKQPQIRSLNKLLLQENKDQIERNRIVNANTIWSKGNKLNDLV